MPARFAIEDFPGAVRPARAPIRSSFMHRLTMFGVLVAASLVSAQVNPYVGRWNITGTGPDTDKVYFLEVKQNGAGLEGLFLDRAAHATPVSWIRVEGGGAGLAVRRRRRNAAKAGLGRQRARLENGKLVGRRPTPGEPCPSPLRTRGGARRSRCQRPDYRCGAAGTCGRTAAARAQGDQLGWRPSTRLAAVQRQRHAHLSARR